EHRKGVSVAVLARRLCRPRQAIYRALMQDRVTRLTERRVKFIDDPLYHSDDAEEAIWEIVHQQAIHEDASPEQKRIPTGLPPYLQDLYRTPLLSATQERALFLQFNYYKYRFVEARRQVDM